MSTSSPNGDTMEAVIIGIHMNDIALQFDRECGGHDCAPTFVAINGRGWWVEARHLTAIHEPDWYRENGVPCPQAS